MTRIIDDVLYQPGALPLLQYALTELFEQRDERTLTHEAYEALGGAAGALVKRAEELYGEQDDSGRELIRQLFLRLVSVGPEDDAAPDTRRRVTVAELMELGTSEDLLEEIVDTFAAYRLLTLDHDPASRRPTVEVAHEALLREWDRLRQWLNESRDDIRKDHALARSAEEWERHGRDESFLLRGTRLEQVEQWAASSSLMQTPFQEIFISQSLLQRDREQQAEAQRKQREAQLERRSQTFLRGLVVVLTVATLVSGALAFFGFTQRQSALTSAANAQNVALVAGSQAALANHDTDTAVALAWQAVALNPDSAAAQAQLSEVAYAPGTIRILEGNDSVVNRIMFSPDDQTAFAGADDGTVLLWELATGRPMWQHQAHTEEVNDVAFSPDGQYAMEGVLTLLDARTGEVIYEVQEDLGVSAGALRFIELSKDGTQVRAAFTNAGLLIWQLETGDLVSHFRYGESLYALATNPQDDTVLIGGEGLLRTIDPHTGAVLRVNSADDGAIFGIATSSDGTRAVTTTLDGTVRLWALQGGRSSVDSPVPVRSRSRSTSALMGERLLRVHHTVRSACGIWKALSLFIAWLPTNRLWQ